MLLFSLYLSHQLVDLPWQSLPTRPLDHCLTTPIKPTYLLCCIHPPAYHVLSGCLSGQSEGHGTWVDGRTGAAEGVGWSGGCGEAKVQRSSVWEMTWW